VSGTTCIYLIANKAISQLPTLEFREQFYALFPAGHRAKKIGRKRRAEGDGVSGTTCIYLIANKANTQLPTLEFREQFDAHFPAGRRAKKSRANAAQKAMGCLAPLVFISLSIKQILNSPHSSFDNNSTPIFPLAAERKNRERTPGRRR